MAKISLLFMKQRLSFHHNSDLIRRRVAETRRVIAVSSLCESSIVRGRERPGNMPELIDVDRGARSVVVSHGSRRLLTRRNTTRRSEISLDSLTTGLAGRSHWQ